MLLRSQAQSVLVLDPHVVSLLLSRQQLFVRRLDEFHFTPLEIFFRRFDFIKQAIRFCLRGPRLLLQLLFFLVADPAAHSLPQQVLGFQHCFLLLALDTVAERLCSLLLQEQPVLLLLRFQRIHGALSSRSGKDLHLILVLRTQKQHAFLDFRFVLLLQISLNFHFVFDSPVVGLPLSRQQFLVCCYLQLSLLPFKLQLRLFQIVYQLVSKLLGGLCSLLEFHFLPVARFAVHCLAQQVLGVHQSFFLFTFNFVSKRFRCLLLEEHLMFQLLTLKRVYSALSPRFGKILNLTTVNLRQSLFHTLLHFTRLNSQF